MSGPVFLLLSLIGCGESSTLEIRPRASLADSAGLAGIRLEVEGRTLTAQDFRPDEAGLTEAKVNAPNEGDLVILVQLRQSGRIAVEAVVSWEMAKDWEWGMDIFRSVRDPLEGCIGCFGRTGFVLPQWAATAQGEALWFAWGGKPKGSDFVY